MTDTTTTRTRTALAGGGVRWTRTDTAFDDTYGMPERRHDHGDLAVAGDSTCTRWEYARNATKWILDRISRTEVVGVPCPADPSRPDDVLSDQRTYYDAPDTHGAPPTRGLPVRTEEVDSWDGAAPQWVTTSRTRYDSHGRQVEVRDALDRPTTTSFTPATGGPVTATTTVNPLGDAATSELAPAWQAPTRTTDPNGQVTDLTYDGLGRLTGVWLPGRNSATQTPNLRYDYLVRSDRPSAVTTGTMLPTGDFLTSITLLDGLLRERQTQTQATGGGRVITDTVHDTQGLVAWQSRGYYNSGAPATALVGTAGEPQIPGITEYRHDGAERVVAEIFRRNGQEAWRTGYAYEGDRVLTTPPAGGTATTVITDARGQTVQRWQHHGPEPAGAHDTTRYAYTKRGELASVTDQADNTWTYRYDQRGRLVESVDPDRGRTVTSYDAAGQELTVTDARGVTLGYTYDDLGRRTSVRDGSPAGPTLAEWVYDTLDNGVGQLTRSIRHAGGQRYVSEVTGYDEAGRPTGTRVVIPESEEGLAGTYSTTASYRPDGSLWTSELPQLGDVPSELLLYAYDDVGAQTTFTSGRWQYVSDAVYNKVGELTQRTMGPDFSRLVVTNRFDEPTGRLAGTFAVPELESQVFDLAYRYDDAGNLLRIADSPSAATPEDTQCFRYDYLQRLAAAWTPAGTGDGNCAAEPAVGDLGGSAPYWQSWTYDHTGNRITQTEHDGAGDTVTTYIQGSGSPHAVTRAGTTGPGGSSVNTYGYDPVGNMTARNLADRVQGLEYDLEVHLSTVTEDGATTSYVYDADGNRLIARDPDGATLYLPEGQELRWDRTTGERTGARYYTHAGATVAVRTGAGVTWLLGDHHGTAEAVVDADKLDRVARRRTTPFGEPRGPEPEFRAGDKGFVGGTEDPTGLTHLGAREYDPQLGRFLTVDPVIDHQDPQQMHGYAYANNAPPSFTDPDGLRACGGAAAVDGQWCPSPKDGSFDVPDSTGGDRGPIRSGVERHGATWSATADGTTDINGWLLPAGGPDVAELAARIDRLMHLEQMAVEETYDAIYWSCEPDLDFCGGDFYRAIAQRSSALHEDDIMLAAALAGPGFAPGYAPSAGARLGRARTLGPRQVAERNGWCRNSFTPDTLVLMADGTYQPIEDVDIGDLVLATDPETGESGPRPVTATTVDAGEKAMTAITITASGQSGNPTVVPAMPANESSGAAFGTVAATHDHPFWNATQGTWTRADDLQPGDQLRTPSRTYVIVATTVTRTNVLTVHNLTIAGTSTYHVRAGDTPVLVHNCPRSSGKDRASDLPSWMSPSEVRRRPGESPRQAADRVMRGRFPDGGYPRGPGTEYNKAVKYASRNPVYGGR
ncbi:MAG: hypothetical protein GEV12_18800 [Micromonosporaceae bacterium]|nr:hypothetical protein [Micromonosporaceae bacterium]